MKRTSIRAWQKCSKSFHLGRENASKRPSVSANRKDAADSLVRQGKPTCSNRHGLEIRVDACRRRASFVSRQDTSNETEFWRALGEFQLWLRVLDQSSPIVVNSAPGKLE